MDLPSNFAGRIGAPPRAVNVFFLIPGEKTSNDAASGGATISPIRDTPFNLHGNENALSGTQEASKKNLLAGPVREGWSLVIK
jgi:hypothetical protein